MDKRFAYRLKLIRPLFVPMILFIGFEVITISWLSANPDSSWRLIVALLPMAPAFWLGLGAVRAISRLDELERKNLMDGMAFSFAVTLLLMVSLGFLNLAGFPTPNGSMIALLMVILWLVGKLWSRRMYK